MNFSQLSTDWMDLPEGIKADGQLFALSDIHGHADLFERMLDQIEQLSLPGERSQVVIAGDMIDKGANSLRVFELAVGAAERPGIDAVEILPGNHEAMLIEAIHGDRFIAASWMDCYGRSFARELGLDPIVMDAAVLLDAIRQAVPEGLLRRLDERQGHYRCGDFLIVHGGLLPERDGIPSRQRANFLQQPLRGSAGMHWAWIREPFLRWQGGWSAYDAGIVVHGHTPEMDRPICSPADLQEASDRVLSHRRINLDVRAYRFRNLAALEAIEGRYRFHMVKDEVSK